MNLLVTGTAGFIGSAFVRMLFGKTRDPRKGFPQLDKGQVISLDALTYAASLENLDLIKNESRHTFVKGDICDAALVERLVHEHHIDAILNFAAESHVDRSIAGSMPFVQANVVGTVTLLDIARKHQLRYLQVSTDEVYGTLGDTGSFTEDTPLQPNSPYSASKAAADVFVRSYVETHKLNAIITRCSNNYGPYQFPEKFLPVAFTRLMQGRKIPVYGQGLNARDWLHVEDHCEGIWLAFTKGKSGEVYNFGGYGEHRNIDVAREILKAFGVSEDNGLEFVTDRKGHDWRYSMDPSKVVRELGWKPRWTFEEGLADMIRWYQDNKSWWEPKLKA